MPRPEKERLVNTPPVFNSFKPSGYEKRGLNQIIITLDEYEAIRLADYEGLDHTNASERMQISRSTFTRLIEKARKKTSSFLIEGAELVIEGGNIHFRGNIIRCLDCEHLFRAGFEEAHSACPSCGSVKLIDMAGGFGHGRCCSTNQNRGAGNPQGRGPANGHGRGRGRRQG